MNLHRANDVGITRAVSHIDTVMRIMGRGDLDIWLRMLKKDITIEGGNNAEALARVQADIDGGDLIVVPNRNICYDLSQRTLCMYLLHRVITTGLLS